MSTFINHKSFQMLGTWHALNKLVEAATFQWKPEEMSPEPFETQQWETSASRWVSNQRLCATTTTVTTTTTTSIMTTMTTMTSRTTTTTTTTTYSLM